MLQTLPALSPQRTPRLVGGLALFLVVNGALLVEQTAIRVVAGSLLYFVLPGYFLVLALLPEQARLEQVVLAIASSTALATLTVLATMLFVPGVLTLYQVWAALALLTLLTLAAALYTMRAGAPGETHSAAASKPADPAGRGWWLALLLLLLLAATLRVANLHHAELQDDEIDIASVAVRILRGEDDVVFQDRRGPAQTVITAVAYAFGARPSEWILRLPVVITALTLIVATVVLASSLFNRWLGLLSGLLLSLDGFVLAYARVVQMQSTLLLMMVVAVLCFYQLYRSDTPKQALTYQLLGSLFFGFGILAHYEMVLLAPVLAFLYFAKYGRGFWQHNRRGLLLMVALLLLTTGSFYLAFILNPAFAETYAYYRHNIVGEIGAEPAQDNVRNYVLVALFYNSIYAFAALYIGATSALLAQLRHLLHGVARRVFVSGVLALLLTVWLVVALVDGEARNNVLLGGTLLVAAVCVVPPRLPLATRLLWLWFAIYFVLYLYVLDEVHIHYYAFSPPLAMLSAWGWHWLYQRGAAHGKAPPAQPEQVGGVGYRRVWGGMAVAITMLSTLYLWLVFVRAMPEYALNFPARQHALFPTPYTVRHGEAFGFPHRSGWRN